MRTVLVFMLGLLVGVLGSILVMHHDKGVPGRTISDLIVNGIAVPVGGRIETVSITMDESRVWGDAVRAAGPDTGVVDRSIWKVGDQYPPKSGADVRQDIMLVNFGDKMVMTRDLLAWVKEHHLRPVSPRTCFAVSEQYPDLHRRLGARRMAIVSIEECSLGGVQQSCGVWWEGEKRGAALDQLMRAWSDYYWLLFVSE